MRIGPFLLVAGLGLLCVGVVSTRADAWSLQLPERKIPLLLAGVTTIDMRDSGIREVRIAPGNTPYVLYPGGKRYRYAQHKNKELMPACRTSAGRLRCVFDPQLAMAEPTLFLPPGHYRLMVNNVEIKAQGEVGAVAIDAYGDVGWKGDATALEVRLPAVQGTPSGYCGVSRFNYRGGQVQQLRVLAGGGALEFEDMRRIGATEVQAAAEVSIRVDRAMDLARIKLLPLAEQQAILGEPCTGDAV